MSDSLDPGALAGPAAAAPPPANVSPLRGRAPAIVSADPYREENRPRMLEVYKQFKEEATDQRWVFERLWWRNLLYTAGRQWIYYDRRTGQWTDKRMARWVPRPVTNKVKDGADSLLSMFSAIQLAVNARPVGHDAANVATAELVDLIAPFIHAEHKMDATMRIADLWNIITGNAFLYVHWDKEAQDGEVVIPFEQCEACGFVASPAQIVEAKNVCPKCGTQRFKPAIGPDGQPIAETVRDGRGRTLALSPLEVVVPHIYQNFEYAPGCLRMQWRPKRYYEAFHRALVPKLPFGKSPSDHSLQLIQALSTHTDIQSRATYFGAGGTGITDGIAEYELHLKPTEEFPQGLWMRVAGDGSDPQIIESDTEKPGPLPFTTKNGEPLFTFIHMTYQPVPGRLLGSGAVDPTIQKQDQINQLDSMMQMIVQRVSNPIWLEPKGSDVQQFTGEPGIVVRYNALASGGAKPERIQGENIPSSLFQLRQQYLDDFEQAMGTYDVLKGTKPSGVEAFSALQLLVERQQSRFTTVFNSRGEAYRKWMSIALELERAFGPTERVINVARPNRGFSFRHFENASLQGAVDIHVEDGSQIPKTSLGRRASIEQANNLGMINATDPEQQYAVLGSLGLSDLMPSLDCNVKAALTQQDVFEEWAESPELQQQIPVLEQAVAQYQGAMQAYQAQAGPMAAAGLPMTAPPPTLPPLSPLTREPWHKASVHVIEHEKWANSDKAREMFEQFPVLKVFFTAHYEEDLQALQAEAMAAAGPAPGQGGGNAPGVGRALQQSNQESGSTADVPHGQGEGAQNAGPR